FSLHGVIDADGSRSLDRLLLTCQGKGAQRVRLDFSAVESVSSFGLSVLTRWGKVYETTERRIDVTGVAPTVQTGIQPAGAIVYMVNAGDEKPKHHPKDEKHTPPKEEPPAFVPAPVAGVAPPAPPAAAESGPEMASLQSKLKRKIVEFRNLFEITQALNLAQDLDEVMNLFGLSVMGQFGLERLALFLVDPDKDGHLVPRHVRGFPQQHFQGFVIPWTVFRRYGPDRSFVTLHELEGKQGGADEVEALRESGFEWAILMWVRRDLEGVLFVGGRGSRRKFEEDDRDLLT